MHTFSIQKKIFNMFKWKGGNSFLLIEQFIVHLVSSGRQMFISVTVMRRASGWGCFPLMCVCTKCFYKSFWVFATLLYKEWEMLLSLLSCVWFSLRCPPGKFQWNLKYWSQQRQDFSAPPMGEAAMACSSPHEQSSGADSHTLRRLVWKALLPDLKALICCIRCNDWPMLPF